MEPGEGWGYKREEGSFAAYPVLCMGVEVGGVIKLPELACLTV